MRLLSWLRSPKSAFARSRRLKAARKTPHRPALELLEDRRVLTTLYVVPSSVSAGGTNFYDLKTAFLAAATSGDTIQIEPASTPGGLDAATTSTAKNLTIQGDPSYLPFDLPQLDPLSLSSGQIDLESLDLTSVDDTNGSAAFIKVVGCNVVADVTLTQTGAQLFNDQIAGTVLLPNCSSPQVLNCPYVHMVHVINSDGTVISGNFLGGSAGDTAVLIDDSHSVAVSGNTITLSDGGVGIAVENSISTANGLIPGGDTSASLTGNTVTTALGGFDFGVATYKSFGFNLDVSLADNNLQQNQVGLYVQGAADGLGNIDAGSLHGSHGGNIFQGYIPGQTFAIATFSLADPSITQIVQANFNIWDVSNPQTVVRADFGTAIETGSWFSVFEQGLHIDLGAFDHGTNAFTIMDHGNGDIGFGVGLDGLQTLSFRGIKKVRVVTQAGSVDGGHALVSYHVNPSPGFGPANLEVHLGAFDDFNLDALFASSSSRLPARQWSVAVLDDGDNQVNAVFDGAAKTMPLDFLMDFGRGGNSFVNLNFARGFTAADTPTGSAIAIQGTGANNHAQPTFEGQNLGKLSIRADLGQKMDTFVAMFMNEAFRAAGGSAVNLAVRATAIDVAIGDPDQSKLTTAFRMNLVGPQVTVDYRNLVVLAPQMVSVHGAGHLAVEFEHTTVAAPVMVDMAGGQTPSTLLFHYDGLLAGELHVRMDGGRSGDTLSSQLFLDAASTGVLDVVERGGAGNDFLMLDVYFVNPDGSLIGTGHGRLRSFKAMLDGGGGYNLYQATANVEVRNAFPAGPTP
jgi:hypothetical protein